MAISHAYVVYTNGVEKVVSTKCLENHFPQNKNDFILHKRYRIWLNGNKGKSDSLRRGFILLLGESEEDILIQKNKKRLKYPNKRSISFASSFSSTDDRRTARRAQEKKVKKIVKAKIKLKKIDVRQDNNNKILTKHFNNLMKQRKPIDDDSSDSDEMEISDGKNNGYKLHNMQSNNTHVLGSGEDLNSDESSEPSVSKEISREESLVRYSDFEDFRTDGERTPPVSIIKVGNRGIVSRGSNTDNDEQSENLHLTDLNRKQSGDVNREGSLERHSEFENCRFSERRAPASSGSRKCSSTVFKDTGGRGIVQTRCSNNDKDKESENLNSTNFHRNQSTTGQDSREGFLERHSELEDYRFSERRTAPASGGSRKCLSTVFKKTEDRGIVQSRCSNNDKDKESENLNSTNFHRNQSTTGQDSSEGSLERHSEFENCRFSERRVPASSGSRKCSSTFFKDNGGRGIVQICRSNNDKDEESENLNSINFHRNQSITGQDSWEGSLERHSELEDYRFSERRTAPASSGSRKCLSTVFKDTGGRGIVQSRRSNNDKDEESGNLNSTNFYRNQSTTGQDSREGSLERHSEFENCRFNERRAPASSSRVKDQRALKEINRFMVHRRRHTTDGASERRRARSRSPLSRNDDMIHLGENVYMNVDIWETSLRKGDSKFCRDLSSVIWSRATLRERCLHKDRANKENASDETTCRKELTPKKYQLLKDSLYYKITKINKVDGALREARMRKVPKYMSALLYDAKNRLKK